jgi:hypothetical protein
METTKKKIISTLLSMTENEISKKLNQLDSLENNEVLSSNNKRFKSDSSSTLSTERSDSATSSLFELSTEASNKQTISTTVKPVKIATTSSAEDALRAAEAAAAAIAHMHAMHFSANKNVNRVSNTQTSKIPVHHHNPYNDYNHDKINFDVNYRPTSEAPPVQPASNSPAKKSNNKNRESVKNLITGLVSFVSSPLFNQAKPLIANTYSSVSNAFSANKNAIGSLSSSSTGSLSSTSASALNSGVLSKMFNSLRTFAILRRNEAGANTNKNSKKKGKLNSAVNNSSTSNSNNLSNQSFLLSLIDSFIKTREALLSGALVPNKSIKPVKLNNNSSNNKNSLNNFKPTYANALNMLKILWKQPSLKQEARSM